jgi:prepilin-type N-terminal cleavage/methylation domain-containing protein
MRNNKGFTLIELLLCIMIIGVMSVILLYTLNPSAQIAKAQDSQRETDLRQITTALEMYYNDNNNYPPLGTFNFGQPWLQDNQTQAVYYMKMVPDDPSCPSCSHYFYQTDGTLAPQWYVLFAKLSRNSSSSSTDCMQRIIAKDTGGCMAPPPGFQYNYCISKGEIDCTKFSWPGQ